MALPTFPKAAEIEDALSELSEARDFFETVTGTEVPSSLKEALDQKWQLLAQGVIVEALLAYHQRQRDIDSQRVIPMDVALSIISDWEERLIKDHVLDPLDVAWKVFTVLPRILEVVWENHALIWELLKALFQLVTSPSVATFKKAMVVLWSGFGAFISAVCLALKPGPFSVVIVSILKDRDRVAKLMRKRALPQKKGRVRRRKVARL